LEDVHSLFERGAELWRGRRRRGVKSKEGNDKKKMALCTHSTRVERIGYYSG
jgi:hypothetical protein